MTELALIISIIALCYTIYAGQCNRLIELERQRQLLANTTFDIATSLSDFGKTFLEEIRKENDPRFIEPLKKLLGMTSSVVNIRETIMGFNFTFLPFHTHFIKEFIQIETRTKELQQASANCIIAFKNRDIKKVNYNLNLLDIVLHNDPKKNKLKSKAR